MTRSRPLAGTRIAITRPAGTGAAWVRRIRALGGSPLLLPGSSLRAPLDAKTARTALRTALVCDVVIFTSPAAIRFAQRLTTLRSLARVVAPGAGTLHALRRAGVTKVEAPAREDSEGMLALPVLRDIRGKRIGIVGAAGGRGLLERELGMRGANVVQAHAYRRLPARLDRRHVEALQRDAHRPLYVLLSSAEAFANILQALPPDARTALLTGSAVASSARLETLARKAGFRRVLRAGSAHAQAMLEAVLADWGRATLL